MKFDTATVQKIFVVGAILFFLMAILGLVGGILGWWDDVGELLMTVGTVGGLILGMATFQTGATEEQVGAVHQAVVQNGEQLEGIDVQLEKLDKLDKLDVVQLELDRQTGVLDRQLDVLTQVRDRL